MIVSQIDANRVVALDTKDGTERWSTTTGGRVDSPPTVHGGLVLFGAADNRPFSAAEKIPPDFQKGPAAKPVEYRWTAKLPIRPRAMVRAAGLIVLGGMEDGDAAVHEGLKGGRLHLVPASGGEIPAAIELASPPVWDGMAAVDGKLFVSSMDGRVVCLGAAR